VHDRRDHRGSVNFFGERLVRKKEMERKLSWVNRRSREVTQDQKISLKREEAGAEGEVKRKKVGPCFNSQKDGECNIRIKNGAFSRIDRDSPKQRRGGESGILQGRTSFF